MQPAGATRLRARARVLSEAEIRGAREAVDALPEDPAVLRRHEGTFGVRDLLRVVPGLRPIADGRAVRRIAEGVLGPGALMVRALLFDKGPGANWAAAALKYGRNSFFQYARNPDRDISLSASV